MEKRLQEHTPGPWLIDNIGRPDAGASIRLKIHDNSPNEIYIAGVYGGDGQNVEANANLIAASPSMLEALKYLNKHLWVNTLNDKGRPTIKTPITETDAYVIQAAIAKAEGRA